jgi:hypothetical protein
MNDRMIWLGADRAARPLRVPPVGASYRRPPVGRVGQADPVPRRYEYRGGARTMPSTAGIVSLAPTAFPFRPQLVTRSAAAAEGIKPSGAPVGTSAATSITMEGRRNSTHLPIFTFMTTDTLAP